MNSFCAANRITPFDPDRDIANVSALVLGDWSAASSRQGGGETLNKRRANTESGERKQRRAEGKGSVRKFARSGRGAWSW